MTASASTAKRTPAIMVIGFDYKKIIREEYGLKDVCGLVYTERHQAG